MNLLSRTTLLLGCLAFGTTAASEESDAPAVKTMSGMSVLGNNEAPKSLVIVPWKSSRLGDGFSMRNLLDERATPVDREVFSRQLNYYELTVGQAGDESSTR